MSLIHRLLAVAAIVLAGTASTAAQTGAGTSAVIAQEAYLKASNTDQNDRFGRVIAASRRTLVVGAYQEDSGATGINGDQTDNSIGNSGAAYVFVRDGDTWTQQAYIKASNTGGSDNFGQAIAICGNTLVVGAIGESSSATGVNGDQADDSATLSGAVYVFVRDGSTWTQQAYLKASNSSAGDQFGTFVAISEDTIVVGAHQEDSGATGINGDQSDDSADRAGAAYVFVRDGSTWTQQAYLKASNTNKGDFFGQVVAVSGDTVVVGALEDSDATGVNGDQSNDLADQSGAAYVFVRDGATWSQQAYLKASNTDEVDLFANQLAISGDTILIAAPFEDSQAQGVDGDDTDNSLPNSGAAYVFERSGTSWSQRAYLKASDGDVNDFFGRVSLRGDMAIVSTWREASSAIGVNGDQTDNSAYAAGAAYVFQRLGTTWRQLAYLKASNTEANDLFGYASAIAGDFVVVSSRNEDSAATGIDGDPFDNGADSAGAAYAFRVPEGTWTDVGGGTAGSAGTPLLEGAGTQLGEAPFALTLTGALPGSPLLGMASVSSTPFPALGGTVYTVPIAAQALFTADGAGSLEVQATWPAGILSGVRIWFQFVAEDPTAVQGMTLSNGLRATTP